MQEAHVVNLYRGGAHTVSELEELFGDTRHGTGIATEKPLSLSRSVALIDGNPHGTNQALKRGMPR